MPHTSVGSEMALEVLQDSEAALVNGVAAVKLGGPHSTKEGPELLSLWENLETEVGGQLV